MRIFGKARSIGIAVALGTLLMAPTTLSAQGFDFTDDDPGASSDGFTFGESDGFTFGEEGEAAPPATASASASIDKASVSYTKYEEGKAHNANKQYDQAVKALYTAVQTRDDTSFAIAGSLHYELGLALYELGYYQAALSHFDSVVQQGPEAPEFMKALPYLVLIGRVLPGEPRRYSRIYDNYLNAFPQEVDEALQSEVGLSLGMAAYRASKLDDAVFFLGHVSQESEYYPKSRYLEGVTYVRQNKGQAAVESFKETLRWLGEQKELTPEQTRLQEYTVAAMGRVFYQVGSTHWNLGEREAAVKSWNTSIKYYSAFPRSSPMWLDSLFEASWAYYRVDNFSKALGLLLTLNSPFFNDKYYPEAMLLQGQIYYTNCHYDRVMDILTDYKAQYGPLKEQMDKLVARLFQPEEVFDFLDKIAKADKNSFDPAMQQVLNAALQDRELRRNLAYIEMIDDEIERIKDDPKLVNSEAGKALVAEVSAVKTLSIVAAGQKGKSRLERVQEELVRLSNMALDIEIETVEKYADRISLKEQDPNALLEFEREVSARMKADDEHLYWTFDGEYWKDELGYYWYHISSQCGR
ncbi:MAG: tetratricopeptide repeat protein [Bradymonadales bacterium]